MFYEFHSVKPPTVSATSVFQPQASSIETFVLCLCSHCVCLRFSVFNPIGHSVFVCICAAFLYSCANCVCV